MRGGRNWRFACIRKVNFLIALSQKLVSCGTWTLLEHSPGVKKDFLSVYEKKNRNVKVLY